MGEMTIGTLQKHFALACKISGFNPSKDTLETAVDRFQERGLRHLLLCIDNGGLLLLCADPEMSRRIQKAIEVIEEELDKEEIA